MEIETWNIFLRYIQFYFIQNNIMETSRSFGCCYFKTVNHAYIWICMFVNIEMVCNAWGLTLVMLCQNYNKRFETCLSTLNVSIYMFGITTCVTGFWMQDRGFGRNRQGETWERISQIRDKFEYDREKRMREKGRLNVNSIFCVQLAQIRSLN